MTILSNRRATFGPLAFLLLLLTGGCAPQRAALLPAPPSEMRKGGPVQPPQGPASPRFGGTAPRTDNAVAVPPPGPDYGKLYREAAGRTRELLTSGNGREALPFWEGFGESPYAAEAAFNRGVLLQLSGDSPGAADQYRRAASPPLFSEHAASNLLGIALLSGDRSVLREVVDNVSLPIVGLPGNRIPEFLGNLAAALGELSRTGEAAEMQRSIVETGGTTPALRWNRAVLAWRRGDIATARKFAAEIPPAVARLWLVEASRVAWDRDASGVPSLDGSAEPRLRAMSRNLAAFREWQKGDAAAARGLLEGTGGGDFHAAEYQTNMGIVLAEQGRWKDAEEVLEQAVASDPSLPDGWLNLGLYREVYQGDGPGALSCYERYGTLNGPRRDEVAKWSEWLKKSSSSQ